MHSLTRAIQVMWWLLFAGIVQAAPILDQQNAPSGNFGALAVANDRTQIQTFTVGVTGVLTRIDVQVSRETQTVEDLVLSLWSTDVTGLPKDLLATVSVPPSAIDLTSPTRPFVTFDLSAEAIAVSAGELFAIVLNSNAPNNPPSFDERYLWEIGGQYDRGTAYTRLDSSLFAQSEDFHFKTYVEPAIIQVTIDIKPGKDPPSINPRSQGVIPVAILTTKTFDATTVDADTVYFGKNGTEAAAVQSALEDVDGDGDLDMILHFNTQDTGIQCGDTSASLTGETLDGQVIQGSDAIQTVGCK